MKRREFIYSANALAATGLMSNTAFASLMEKSVRYAHMQDELGYHRIQSVTFGQIRMHYPRLVGKNARSDVHGYGTRVEICKLATDQGATGWASLRGGRDVASREAEHLVGKRISDVFQVSTGIIDDRCLPFDIALHDLAGMVLGKPVYELLGRTEPHVTKYYSGMIYFDDLEPMHAPGGIDKILMNCQYDYDHGYRQFKLKIGRGHRWMSYRSGLMRDIEVTKAVTASFPDCDILVDGNNGFTCSEFIEYLKGIGEAKLFWIEEPFHETVADYRELRKWMQDEGVSGLLADGEAGPDQVLLDELMRLRLLDVHLTDIQNLGFSNWRKLMPKLTQYQVKASPHAWGSLLKTHYIAHLAGGLGNTVTIEGVTSTSDDVDLSGYYIENGNLVPSDRPGFGMALLR